jgi:hypothetical protein
MTDSDRRDASLDMTGEEFGALLAGVTALAEQEVAAARFGRVFERPPSAAEIDRVIGADRALPADGESVEDLLAACAAVLDAGRRTTPAFFGYVQSPPAPVAVAGDLLASAADQNLTSWRSGPAAVAVEHQTLRWIGELVGFDAAATGILVSGGSAANLSALLIALRAVTGPDEDRRAMRVYASAETHFSVAKAARALGVGLEPVAVDRERRLDPGALQMAVASDRAAGLLPICVPACTAPTPSASTHTSGCTPRSTAAHSCYTTRRPPRGRSAPVPTTTCASSAPKPRRPSPSGTTGSSSAAASGRSSCGRRCAFTAGSGSRRRSARTSASPRTSPIWSRSRRTSSYLPPQD